MFVLLMLYSWYVSYLSKYLPASVYSICCVLPTTQIALHFVRTHRSLSLSLCLCLCLFLTHSLSSSSSSLLLFFFFFFFLLIQTRALKSWSLHTTCASSLLFLFPLFFGGGWGGRGLLLTDNYITCFIASTQRQYSSGEKLSSALTQNYTSHFRSGRKIERPHSDSQRRSVIWINAWTMRT